MARSLFVAPAAEGVGLARTCLGLLRALDRRGVKVAFVKPVAQPRADGGPDRSAARVTAIMALRPPEPLSTAELESQLGEGGLDVVLEKIVAAWEPTYDGSDVVVVEGLSAGPSKLYASSLNQALAGALDADVVLADSWPADADADGVAEQLAIAAGGYVSGEQARVVGCVVHGLPGADAAAAAGLRGALAKRRLRLIAAVPHRPELTWPRVRDLVRELHPEVLHEGDLSRRIKDVAVMARGIPGGIRVLDTGRLVVVPGDRHEVIMAAYLAELSGTHLAALLLSAGTAPDPQVSQLTRATGAAGLPVLLVESDSYQTATRVRDLDRGLPADDLDRIEGVTDTIADALDPSWLGSLTSTSRPRRFSPAAFRYELVERARAADALVVLPEGTEPRTMRAAVACAERGIARCLLLGAPDEVAAQARHLGLRLPGGVTVVDPRAVAERYVAPLAELRRPKGWTVEVAREHLSDPITVGTMMLRQGEVDGLVCGAAHTTAATVRPALQILGTRPGCRLVSSVFFMCLPDQVVIYGDCAINPQPSAEDLADIAIQSAASARAFGIEPRVAMISFSTGSSGAGTDVDKVAEATRIVRQREPGLAADGPMQYDAAAIASVGQAKRPGSPVAGRATVFIFPDLDAGNTTYKAVQRSAQVISIGPMLQGLAKPVNDLSRGALVEDIIYTVALTAIQARAAARSLLSPVLVFPPPFGPMAPKICSDTLPYLAAELRGDCQRPLLHLPGVTPVTRQLLRHYARREPLGVGQEPAAEGDVLAYAGLLHQRLDALDRRDVLAACGIIKRPAGEEVGRARRARRDPGRGLRRGVGGGVVRPRGEPGHAGRRGRGGGVGRHRGARPGERVALTPVRQGIASRLLVPGFWATVSIVTMWLAVLFDGIFGGDMTFTNSPSQVTIIPSAVAVALFAAIATASVAKRAFGRKDVE